jgi:hypothetical protein
LPAEQRRIDRHDARTRPVEDKGAKERSAMMACQLTSARSAHHTMTKTVANVSAVWSASVRKLSVLHIRLSESAS